jgi:ABC-type molybdenum transport system ATPase subunit/photorepair protein PhrA
MATHCKGLSEASLFLDEFASSFDEQHRTNAVMAIKSIMEQLPFSQLWMVSHYHSQYGALGNAEVCVLSSTNIVVPEVYNQHVEMSSLNVAA